MENREIAIQLSGVKKMYKLGQIGGGTLTADLQSWWARVRGKEDPNTKIGSNQRLIGQTFMALNGIDLTVYKGEALGIIGSNGAGKSTMLKLLSQVTAPTAGTIRLNGRVASMLEVGTGFHGEMTGRENVYLNGAILGMTKAEIDAKMEDIIEFSEVRDFIDTPVKRYSSGMYVKLAFSVAAHLDSEIMIMDEVLAVGDMAFQKKCLDKMRDAAKKEGRTVLYVSHNMNTIRQLCDRCVVLDKGKVVFEGDVEEAIGIYMNRGSDNLTEKDYTTYIRPNWIYHDNLRIQAAKLLNYEKGYLPRGETLSIEFEVLYTKPLENICLRYEIRAKDDSPIGTAVIMDIPLSASLVSQKFIVSFKFDGLVAGDFLSYFTFFTKNSFGTNINIDWVPGLAFSVENTAKDTPLEWDNRQWGNICFQTAHLEVIG